MKPIKKQKLFVPGVAKLPEGFILKDQQAKFIEVIRPDNLVIFLDRQKSPLNELANRIRILAPKESVVMCVGIVRGVQISLSYSRRYAPEVLESLQANLQNALQSALGKLTPEFPEVLTTNPKSLLK